MIINWIGQVLGLHRSASAVGTMEPLLRSSAIDEPGPLASVIDSPDMLHKELERARRYERGLSVSVLTVEPLSGGEEGALHGEPDVQASVRTSGPPQVVALLAAAGLRDMLRQSDVLCYQPTENRFVLALAESDAEQAEKALVRISGIFRDRLALDVQAGISRFPGDALTLAGLIDSAARTSALGGAMPGEHGDPVEQDAPERLDRAPSGHRFLGPASGERWFGSNGQRARRVTPLEEVNDDE